MSTEPLSVPAPDSSPGPAVVASKESETSEILLESEEDLPVKLALQKLWILYPSTCTALIIPWNPIQHHQGRDTVNVRQYSTAMS